MLSIGLGIHAYIGGENTLAYFLLNNSATLHSDPQREYDIRRYARGHKTELTQAINQEFWVAYLDTGMCELHRGSSLDAKTYSLLS